MTVTQSDFDTLLGEHIALSRQYGAVQARCSQLMNTQRTEIARLEAQVLRLRAAVVARDTALAFAREDRQALEARIPGLPRRIVMSLRVEVLVARLHGLLRERLHWQWHTAVATGTRAAAAVSAEKAVAADLHRKAVLCLGDDTHTSVTRRAVELAGGQVLPHGDGVEDLAALEASLVAADLVICQTGCLSHGAYWRVQDHCKRTGKTCVMVDPAGQPQVVRFMRGTEAPGTSGTPGPNSTARVGVRHGAPGSRVPSFTQRTEGMNHADSATPGPLP